ncbi:MAG: hypothetical protein ABH875_02105 [Candidatus Omnitrophota bacterium]
MNWTEVTRGVRGLLRAILNAWIALGNMLGRLATRAFLIAVFYAIVTPIGLMARVFEKDFLDLRFGGNAQTYWTKKRPDGRGNGRYTDQY